MWRRANWPGKTPARLSTSQVHAATDGPDEGISRTCGDPGTSGTEVRRTTTAEFLSETRRKTRRHGMENVPVLPRRDGSRREKGGSRNGYGMGRRGGMCMVARGGAGSAEMAWPGNRAMEHAVKTNGRVEREEILRVLPVSGGSTRYCPQVAQGGGENLTGADGQRRGASGSGWELLGVARRRARPRPRLNSPPARCLLHFQPYK